MSVMTPRALHLRVCPPPETDTAICAHAPPLGVPTPEPLSLERLFVEHANFVAHVVFRVIGRDDEVDDVVQEVFLAAMKCLGSIQNPDAVRGWLKTIAVRKSHKHLRKRRLRFLFGFDSECRYEQVADSSCDPENRALLSRVYQQLDTLPVDERLAWTLRYVDGEPLEAVGKLCGCSLATAKRRILAAKTKLSVRFRHA